MAELIGAGATGIEIGSQVVTGSAPFIGPFSAHAGVAAGILTGFGIVGWASHIYFQKVAVIEAEYGNCIMDGP